MKNHENEKIRLIPLVLARGERSVTFPLQWTLPEKSEKYDEPELIIQEVEAVSLSGELCVRLVIQQDTYYVVAETGLVDKVTTLHRVTEMLPVPGVFPGNYVDVSAEATMAGSCRAAQVTTRGTSVTVLTGDCKIKLDYTVFEPREVMINEPKDLDADILAEDVQLETVYGQFSQTWDLSLPMEFSKVPLSLGDNTGRFANIRMTALPGWVKVEGDVIITIAYLDSEENPFEESFVFPIRRYLEVPDATAEMTATGKPRVEIYTCRRQPGSLTGVIRGLLQAEIWLSRMEALGMAMNARSHFFPGQSSGFLPGNFLLEELIGVGSSQTLIEREIFFSRPARKVREPVDAQVRNLRHEVIPNKVIVRGVLHKQIFAVDAATGVVFAQDVNESFVHFVDVPGASPGMRVFVDARVEFVKIDIFPGGERARQVTIIEIRVKVVRPIKFPLPPVVSPITPSPVFPVPKPTGTVYIVRSGDSIWKIARMFGVSMESIIAANNLQNPNLIFPGQKLIIPR